MELYQELAAQAILSSGALKFEDALLNSGNRYPFHLDLTQIRDPDNKHRVINALHMSILSYPGDLLADLSHSTYLLVGSLSDRLRIPHLTVRAQQVAGPYTLGNRVVAFEGYIDNGSKQLRDLYFLEQLGLKVVGLVAVMDLEHRGVGTIRQAGFKLATILSLTDLIGTAQDLKPSILSPEQLAVLLRYQHSQYPGLATLTLPSP